MTHKNTLLALALSVAALPVFAAPVTANKYEQAELDMGIKSCIAEVGNHANYEDASQVRHEIVVTKRRTVGHKLSIETFVYSASSDEAIRAYVTKCIVYRDNKPVRFSISETDSGA